MYESISLGLSKDINTLTRFIRIYDDVLSVEECELLIKYYDECEHKYEGRVYTAEGITLKQDTKSVQQVDVEFESEADNILSKNCERMLQAYCEEQPWYPPAAINDIGYHIKRYEPGSGYFNEHIDVLCPNTARRTVVVQFYLNTVEEGGETEFTELGIKCPPVRGRCLMFPAFFLYPHAGHVPISGPKYITNIFVGYDMNDMTAPN